MKFFKMFKLKSVRDRPGNKKKRKLSTVIVALICLLSIGVLSMLSAFSVSSSGGSSGSSSGGSSSQTPTPTPDGSDTGSSVLSPVRGANDIEILSLLDFSHPYEYKSDGLQIETNGFCIDERIQYGTVDTDNESLNFNVKPEDVGKVSGSELTLYYTDKSTNLNPKYVAYNSLDCLTFDFDIRSETGIMPDILFETNAVDADTGELFFIQFYLIFNEARSSYCFAFYTVDTGELTIVPSTEFTVEDLKDSVHISYVFTRFYMMGAAFYTNGFLIAPASIIFGENDIFTDFNIKILDHTVKENESISIDNVCVAAYGNGSGEYTGDLSKLNPYCGCAESEEIHIESVYNCSDWILSDELEAKRAVYNTIHKDIYVPSTGTELNKLSFSEIKTADYDTLRTLPGLRLDTGYRDLLSVTTLNDYLKVRSYNSTDSGFSVGFYMVDEATTTNSNSDVSKLILSQYDYVTIDFDVWTDSSFFDSMEFKFVGRDSKDNSLQASYPELMLTGESWYKDFVPYDDPQVPMHLTFAIMRSGSNSYKMNMYVNGELFKTVNYALDGFEKLYYITLWFSRGTITSGRSVCFDNFQVMGFGNGDGSYSGTISNVFTTEGKTLELQNVSDSVIYNNNKKSEE